MALGQKPGEHCACYISLGNVTLVANPGLRVQENDGSSTSPAKRHRTSLNSNVDIPDYQRESGRTGFRSQRRIRIPRG
jgi:hypothetical protein